MPTRLVSDKGPALISNLMRDFMALVGTEHVKTMAASKEENSIVERLNREVMRHLRNLVFDRQAMIIGAICFHSSIESSSPQSTQPRESLPQK